MQSRYFPYLSEHRWLFGLGVALLILEAYVDSLTPSLYRNIVNKALPSGDMESAISNSWILIVLSIVLGVSQLLSTYAFSRMGEGVSARLRTQLFEAINRSPFGYEFR
jgi:ABC-type multidrug transport system fused ATPase/permease subunit